MDGLSAAASIITIIETVKAARNCLEKIRRSLGAEDLLLELLNEASDFQVLLANVAAFNDTGNSSAKSKFGLDNSLDRTQRVFTSFLDFVTQKLFSKADDQSPSPTRDQSPTPSKPRASRRAWFYYERDLLKHRDALRQARESLHFALAVTNTGISLDLREVIWTSQLSVQTKLAAHAKAVDDIRVMVQQMAEHSVRDRSPSISSDTTLKPMPSNETLSLQRSNSSDAGSIAPDDAVCFSTTMAIQNCPKVCSCKCHSTSLVKAPGWMRHVTGLLFMRYSGTPVLDPVKCTKRRCKERHQSKINASYYFPSWMLHRMVELVARWDDNAAPKMSLRIMRVIPDQSLLFAYAMEGNKPGIQDLFVQNLASPIDIRESDGRSALHIALYYGHVSTAQFLLDQTADREYKDKYFQSAIGACWEIAFQRLPIPTIEPCVIGGPTEYSDFLDERDLSPVHKIVLGISTTSLADYLDLSSDELNKRDVMGKTPLHFAAARGDADAVATLLKYHADPNLTTDAMWTPLHEAAISSSHTSLQLLLEAGSHVDALNNRGQTALALAAYVRDDLRYLQILIEHGTNIHLTDKTGLTALHRASIRDRVDSAQYLLTLGADVDALDNRRLSPIHTCVLNNSHRVLELLLVSGVRVGGSSTNGKTLLHDAAAVADLITITNMINAVSYMEGVDPDSLDSDDQTALEVFDKDRPSHVAEDQGQHEKVRSAFVDLLERLRESHRISALSEKLSEVLEVQSTTSDADFFEAMERMESSVESLHAPLEAWNRSCGVPVAVVVD